MWSFLWKGWPEPVKTIPYHPEEPTSVPVKPVPSICSLFFVNDNFILNKLVSNLISQITISVNKELKRFTDSVGQTQTLWYDVSEVSSIPGAEIGVEGEALESGDAGRRLSWIFEVILNFW